MPVILVSHLQKTYESWRKLPGFFGTLRSLVRREKIRVPAVQDVSFTIEEGEFVGFIGPNGAGKTTILKILSGILWPTAGTARVLGYVPWKRHPDHQRQFAIVLGQKNQLWWDLPAHDTFLLNKEIYDIPTREFKSRVKLLGDTLNVTQLFEIPVRKLSLGERMKCELINALLHRPRVLLLDEPTIGLDVLSQKAIRDFLKEWNAREGTTILLTSHIMADIEALCARVIVIQTGRIQYDGELHDLVRRVADHKHITVTFDEPVSRARLQRFSPLITKATELQITLRVAREDVRVVAKKLLDSFPVSDLLIKEIPIEEVVRKLFQEHSSDHLSA